jgi:hypothetical protein
MKFYWNGSEEGVAQEKMDQLMELEEERILGGFRQEVQKLNKKYWHDRHIKKKRLKEGYLVPKVILRTPCKFICKINGRIIVIHRKNRRLSYE